MKKFLVAALLLIGTASRLAQAEPLKITFWHAMSGSLEEKLNKILGEYNNSQKEYVVEAINKGNYTDTLNALVASYRGGKQPAIAQVFEVGTQSMMLSGAILPVEDLFQKYNLPLNKKDFLPPVAAYYSNIDGKLISMPFNSSTPILYYNKDLMQKYGIKKIPETWDEMFQVSKEIKAKMGSCGLIYGWQSWVLIENYSSINNLAVATPDNGFRGLDVHMNLTSPEILDIVSRTAKAVQDGEFCFEGRRSEAPLRAFLTRKSIFFLDSSSSIGSMKKMAKFSWGTAFQPFIAGKTPQNSLIGGASLWVMKGHTEAEYKGVLNFFQFLVKPEIVAEWHQATGYIPITYSAYEQSKKDGFYLKDPNQETAVKQLLRGAMTTNSRGIRLGNFSQVREVIEEYLEKIWAGTCSAKSCLEEADKTANLVLKRFAELRGTPHD